MELRDYQNDAITAVSSMFRNGSKKALVVLPTGCGKTVVFAKMTEMTYHKNKNVLILAHRGELLEQAQDKLFKVSGIHSSIEKAECSGVGARVVIGSLQTLCRDNRLECYPKDYFSLIVVDECHHILTQSYQKILNYFSKSYVVGVTATPDRGDQKTLILDKENNEGYFDGLAYEYSIIDAVRNGYLARVNAQRIPIEIDLTNVQMKNGDYDQSDVDEILQDNLYKIAEVMKERCRDRKTVVFMPLVNSSKMFANILNICGFNAVEVNGNTKDRTERLQDFENGKYNVMCNAMLLTEGWDCPSVDCVIVLRPTKVRALYQQMVGRGMRLAPNKKDCLLLDFLWLTEKHDLCSPASIIATNKEVEKNIDAVLSSDNKEYDLLDVAEIEEEDFSKKKRDNNKSMLEELEKYTYKDLEKVDPIFRAITDDDLKYWEPLSIDDMLPPTEPQLNALKNFNISTENIKNKGFATLVLKKLFKRKDLGLATPKQLRFLKSKKFKYADFISKDDAQYLMSQIADNGWKVPKHINPKTYGEF